MSLEGILPAACGITDTSEGHCPCYFHIFFSQFLFVNPFMHVAAKLLDYLRVVSQIYTSEGSLSLRSRSKNVTFTFFFFFSQFLFHACCSQAALLFG